jgi:hypothetical protein
MRQTWVLRNGGFQLGGQKRPERARERRRELLATIMGTTQEKEKEGKRNGRGGTRVGTTPKKWEKRAQCIPKLAQKFYWDVFCAI